MRSLQWNRSSLFRLFLVIGLMLCSFLARAEEAEGDDAAGMLVARLASMKTFEADFVQFLADKTGAIQQTSGNLKAMKPGYFYWHTDPPLEQVVVSDGTKVSVYDPDLEQVTIQPMDPETRQTPAMLISGRVDEISRNYHVNYTKNDGIEIFSLEPKGKESLFDRLQVKFVEGMLVEMRMRDGLGQKSTLTFLNVKLNPPLSETDFSLSYPEGTDIISQ